MSWRLPSLVVLTVAVLAACAAVARAGTYQVVACSQAPTHINESWEPFNSAPTHLTVGQVCPPAAGAGEATKATGMFVTDTLGSSGVTPDGAVAGWRFIAPAGTEIVALQDDRYIGAYADNGWMPFVKADGTTLETCTFTLAEETCSVGNPFGSGSLDGVLAIKEAATLTVGVKCAAPGGCTAGSTLHRAWAALYGAKVTLSSPAPPSLGTLTGALWGVSPGTGYHKGIETVSLTANGLTGIAKVAMTVDGRVVASKPGVCNFTRPLPCESLPASFQLDTGQFPDGLHTVAVEATDGAGDVERQTEQVALANNAPPAPVGLKAVAQPNGAFVVSWSDPPDPTPITGANYQLCSADGTNCGGPQSGRDTPVTLGAAAAGHTIRVWLTDAAGNSNPATAVSTALSALVGGAAVHPAGVGQAKRLRLKISLRRHRLTVVALAPTGFSGSVQFAVVAVRGRAHFGRRVRSVRIARGRAVVAFVLSRRVLSAKHLAVRASARGVVTATTTLVLYHPRTPGTSAGSGFKVAPPA